MNPSIFVLPVTPIDPKLKPMVSTVQLQKDGSLLVGLLFAKPSLLKVRIEGNKLIEAIDQNIEETFDQDFLGITGGLRGTRTGDTAFATLHRAGSGLFGMFKKSIAPENSEAVWNDLARNGNALGFSYRHSLVQIQGGQFLVRILKNGGALLDTAHIGDFIFGLTGGALFRQPYLNAEKTYVLRDDLEPNYRLHKVEDGVFWLAGNENRLMKVNLTDVKALPTTKRLPGSPFRASVDSEVDGWLYGIAAETVFRLRVNVENRLDELQEIKKFDGALPLSVTSAEIKAEPAKPKKGDPAPEPVVRKGRVWVSVERGGQAEIYEIQTESQVDNEDLPAAPMAEKVFASDEYSQLSNLLVIGGDTLLGSCEKKTGELGLFHAKVL